ncbi:MAG: FHA domain-containing protein [Pirellulales bacterium]
MPEPSSTTAPKSTAAPTSALTLRVCGTPQDGRLVRLNGAKCTIGSDSQCTLRLRAAGVIPFHCLIIRGPERTIVQRWSEDTRLNGQPFTAAMLGVGDRLTIGTVEFEVMDGIGSPTAKSAPSVAALTAPIAPSSDQPANAPTCTAAQSRGDDCKAAAGHGRARARRLLTRLREVHQENELNGLRLARLEEEHRKLREEVVAADERRRDSMECEVGAQTGEADRASLDQQDGELEQLRAQLEDEREALQNDRASFAQAWAAFEHERTALESQRLLLQQELRTFEEHKHSLTLERIDWQTDTSRAEADIAIRRDEADRRAAALEKQRLEHELARRRLDEGQQDLTRRQAALQQSENDLVSRKQQIEEQRLALDSERQAFVQERAQLDSDHQRLAGEQAALTGGRQELETLRKQDRTNEDELSGRLAEQARHLTEATERLNRSTQELEQQQALLEAARQELDDERAQWDAERQTLLHDHEQQLAELRLELDRRRTAPPETAPDGDRAVESEEEVFARLRSMSLLKTEVAEDPAGETLDGPESDTGHSAQVEERQPGVRTEHSRPNEWSDTPVEFRKGALPPDSEQKDQDDESIDDYMAQLLKRVRGVGSAHQAPASQAPEPPVRATQNGPASSSISASSEQIPTVQEVPAKLARRAPAPELSSDLAAMRELANFSARAAIDHHAYRNWGRAAFGKLTIALLAAGTGAGAVCFAPAPDSMLMYAGLSSFVVALFWLLQAGILMNHVVKASRRNDQLSDASGDESIDDDSLESSDESAVVEEDEFAPAELIHAHDGYEVSADEAVADQTYEPAATECDDCEALVETAPRCSDNADDEPPVSEPVEWAPPTNRSN